MKRLRIEQLFKKIDNHFDDHHVRSTHLSLSNAMKWKCAIFTNLLQYNNFVSYF